MRDKKSIDGADNFPTSSLIMDAIRLSNISSLLTLKGAYDKGGRNLTRKDACVIKKGVVVCNSEKILWVGKEKELPPEYVSLEVLDCKNYTVTPELVDCHTHIVFGGDRSREYSMRLNGATYEEIAESGGGILSTVKSTNELSREELFATAKERCGQLYSYGIGSIEIKSGYGLNFEKEYEISHIIDDLKKALAPRIQIHNTFMAAHAVPKEFSSSSDYLKKVAIPLLKKLHGEGVVDSVDIFHERGYFNSDDVSVLFSLARELDIPRRCHADEFTDNKGALTACQYGALSADHLLRTGADGIEALAESKTIAILLPGTGFFLGKDQADARSFLDRGCRVAIGSDYNPGSCHFDNVLQIASMAAPRYKMNFTELWAAITLNAARALGLKNQGAIVEGQVPRFSFFDVKNIDEIGYFWGRNFAVTPRIF